MLTARCPTLHHTLLTLLKHCCLTFKITAGNKHGIDPEFLETEMKRLA